MTLLKIEKESFHDGFGAAMFGFVVAMLVWALLLTIVMQALFVLPVASDTTDQIDRAAQSPHAEGMAEHLEKAKAGFEEHGMTEGHYALILKHTDNDIAEDYADVNEALERARQLSEMDHDSTKYANGMIQLRNDNIDDINPDVGWWLVLHRPPVAAYFIGSWSVYLIIPYTFYWVESRSIEINPDET